MTETTRRELCIPFALQNGWPPRPRMTSSKLLAIGTGAEMVPDTDQNDRGEEDERGDGVDFRSDAAAEASPNFEGQRVVAAVEEESDRNFVHRKSEDQQPGCDERQL